MSTVSALYTGHVIHARHRPKKHRMKYRVFSMLVDLDELPDLDRRLRLFGHNRTAIFSFWDKDHGNGRQGELRTWVEAHLGEAGIHETDMRISLLCYPRMFGYVFNPLTVYFCHTANGMLKAILYEVCNTFHERHTYIIPAPESGGTIRQSCAKELYVSPFVPMDCTYHFRIDPPDERVLIAINETDAGGALLFASFAGERQALCDRTLGRALLTYPLMTVKIMGGIHWEALKIWSKGIPFHRHTPVQNPVASTVVTTSSLAGTAHKMAG